MKRALVHYTGNLSPVLSGLITAPLTARALGVDGRGIVALIVLVSTTLITIGAFGLGWLAREAIAEDPLSFGFWRRKARLVSFAAAPLFAATAAILSLALQLSVIELVLVLVFYVIGAFSVVRSVEGNGLIALGRNHSLGVVNIAYSTTVATLIIVFFVVGILNVALTVVANALGLLVQIVLLTRFVRSATATSRVYEAMRAKDMATDPQWGIRSLLAKSGRSWRAQVLDAAAVRLDTVLVALFANVRQVGLYSVVALLPQIAYVSCLTIVQTSFARSPRLDRDLRVALLFQACLIASFGLTAIGLPVAYWGIPIFFGAEFTDARDYLLSGSVMAVGLAGMSVAFFDAARRERSGIAVLLLVLLPLLAATPVSLLDPFSGVAALGFGFLLSSVVYVMRHAGIAAMRPQLGHVRSMLTGRPLEER